MELNRESNIPLYEQIANDIKDKILKDELKHNAKIATEKELMEEYEVSRLTVRKAISILVDEGLIVKRKGKGMFVKKIKINFDMNDVKGFNQMLYSQGLEYERKMIKHEEVYPPNYILDSLGLEPGLKLHSIQQAFYVEGTPIGLLVTYLAPSVGFTKELAAKLVHSSFLEILENELNISPMETKYSIDATAATSDLTKILNVSLGYPLLKVERTTLNTENETFESTIMYLCSNLYQFKFDIRKGNKDMGDYYGLPQKLLVQT